MLRLYRFSYTEKREEPYEGKPSVIVTSERDGAQYPLEENEFALATLFDGNRSPAEVLDAFFKLKGTRLASNELDSFISDLLEAGMLVEQSPAVEFGESHEISEASPQSSVAGQRQPRHQRQGRQARQGRGGAGVVSLVRDEQVESGSKEGAAPPVRRKNTSGDRRSRHRPEIVLNVPVRWLLPVGYLVTLPIRYRALLFVMLAAVAFCLFGFAQNSLVVERDLNRFSDPLTFFQAFLLSAFTVNLIGQLARVAVFHRLTLKVPRFGIALLFSFVPRFYTDLPISRDIKEPGEKQQIYAASLVGTLVVFVGASFAWLVAKNTSTLMPVLCVGIAMLSALRFVLSVNPLAERPGYRLLASWSGYPGIRQRALDTIFNRKRVAEYRKKAGGEDIPTWVLVVYGILVVTYIVLLVAALIWYVGGALERQFGGFGVLLFIGLGTLLVLDPFNRSRRPGSGPEAASGAGVFKRGFLTGAQRRRRTRRVLLQLLFLVAMVYLATRAYVFEPSGALTIKPLGGSDVRAVLRAEVDEIFVREGQYVEKGMVLAKMSDDEERKNILATEARIRQLQAKLDLALEGAKAEEIALARQQLETARAKLKFSTSQAERYRTLVASKTVSQQQYEDAQASQEVDAERVEEAMRNLELIESGSRAAELEAIRSELAEQQAELGYYQEKLERTRLKATSSGYIVSGTLDYAVGDYMDLGDLLLTIEDTSAVIAEIAIPESDIGDVAVGAQARVKIWKFPMREFTGVVDAVAPAAEVGDYGKVVRARIRLPNPDGTLQAGLTGHGKIMGPEMMAYEAFTRAIVRFFRIELWSWLP